MSDRAKVTGVAAGIVAILTILASTQGLKLVELVVGSISGMFMLPLFAPVLMAIFVGVACCAWLPHMLPEGWTRKRTLTLTRLLGGTCAFVLVFSRYPSAVGAQYGMFAAAGAYMVWTMAQGFLYERFPLMRPESLYDNDHFCKGIRDKAMAVGRRRALEDVVRLARESSELDTQTIMAVREELNENAD